MLSKARGSNICTSMYILYNDDMVLCIVATVYITH